MKTSVTVLALTVLLWAPQPGDCRSLSAHLERPSGRKLSSADNESEGSDSGNASEIDTNESSGTLPTYLAEQAKKSQAGGGAGKSNTTAAKEFGKDIQDAADEGAAQANPDADQDDVSSKYAALYDTEQDAAAEGGSALQATQDAFGAALTGSGASDVVESQDAIIASKGCNAVSKVLQGAQQSAQNSGSGPAFAASVSSSSIPSCLGGQSSVAQQLSNIGQGITNDLSTGMPSGLSVPGIIKPVSVGRRLLGALADAAAHGKAFLNVPHAPARAIA